MAMMTVYEMDDADTRNQLEGLDWALEELRKRGAEQFEKVLPRAIAGMAAGAANDNGSK